MNKHYEDFKNLRRDVLKYLANNLNYNPNTINNYAYEFQNIREFIFSNNYLKYSKEVGNKYLISKYKGKKKKDLKSPYQYIGYNAIEKLNQFIISGTIKTRYDIKKYPLKFRGAIGEQISEFIKHLETNKRPVSTIQEYQRYLFDFMLYCENEKIQSITKIDLHFLLIYINQHNSKTKYGMVSLIRFLRGFLKYLYESNKIDFDLSRKIPSVKIIRQPNIPSTYSEKEIYQLLNSIDKSSVCGKRNYLIILLASRLGFRAADIGRLKFSNIDWNSNSINILQFKTGRELKLPLLPDVGNAIIDYLKNERPKYESPFIILKGRPPYSVGVNGKAITLVVQKAITKAGLRKKNRKFGAHSLRHSLAQRMLNNSTSIHVISEVLGHKDYESSKFYLRIDLESMKNCMLDIPQVQNSFYTQRGGVFYE